MADHDDAALGNGASHKKGQQQHNVMVREDGLLRPKRPKTTSGGPNTNSTSTSTSRSNSNVAVAVEQATILPEKNPGDDDDEDEERTRQLFNNLAKTAVGPNFVKVSLRQKENPLLKHIRNVPYTIVEQTADFEMGKRTCALYISLKYNNLHPHYIHQRIRELGRLYQVRVLLVLVDIRDCQAPLIELARLCVMHEYTLIVGWSEREIGRYIETYKMYEHKSADSLRETVERKFVPQFVSALTSIRSINRTNAMTLLTTFSNLKNVAHAKPEDIRNLPNFGDKKVEQLQAVLEQPFINPKSKKPSRFTLSSKASADQDRI